MRKDNVYELPQDLPPPEDDGAARHITGMKLPNVSLQSTQREATNLGKLLGKNIVYIFPRIGHPQKEPPQGWSHVPGARGCTPQSCAFRDAHKRYTDLKVSVFGVSAQPFEELMETAQRLELPYPLLHDNGTLEKALDLPYFSIEGKKYLKRLTFFAEDGVIKKVFYPVFPPDQNAIEVLNWLEGRSLSSDKALD